MVFADTIAWGLAISFWASAELAASRLPTKQMDRKRAEDRISTADTSNESVHPGYVCLNPKPYSGIESAITNRNGLSTLITAFTGKGQQLTGTLRCLSLQGVGLVAF